MAEPTGTASFAVTGVLLSVYLTLMAAALAMYFSLQQRAMDSRQEASTEMVPEEDAEQA